MTTFTSVTTGLPPATFLKPSCYHSPMRTPRKTSLASHLRRFVFGVIFFDDANDDVAEYVQWKTLENLAGAIVSGPVPFSEAAQELAAPHGYR
jgi:hypothetical protein